MEDFSFRVMVKSVRAAGAYVAMLTKYGATELAEACKAYERCTIKIDSVEMALELHSLIFKYGVPNELVHVETFLKSAGVTPPRLKLDRDSSVAWLLLDGRSTNALKNCDLDASGKGVNTVGELLELAEEDLGNVDHLGRKGAEVILERTALYGLRLRS